MSTLRISVIIPTYNRAHLIERALNSALSQLDATDEVIVVDDDSRDNTEEVVRTFGDRVRYFRIPNQGAGSARNFGIDQCRNELVAFLDSDDEWMPHKIALQRRIMQARTHVLFCFTNFAVTDRQGNPHHRFLVNWSRDHRNWDDILGPGETFSSIGPLPEGADDFRFHIGDLSLGEMRSAYVLTSSLMVRRHEAGDALRFAEDVSTLEDLECFGRLSLRGPAAYLDVETTWQHGHSGERLTDLAGLSRSDAQLKIMERVWGSHVPFLQEHGADYHRELETLRRSRTADLIALGRTSEARSALRLLDHPPVSYRLMALLPGPVARFLFACRQRLVSR